VLLQKSISILIITIISYIIITLILIKLQIVLFSLLNIITMATSKSVKWKGHVAHVEEKNAEGRKPLGSRRHRWKNTAKLYKKVSECRLGLSKSGWSIVVNKTVKFPVP
jgi:hypothetical protein